MKKIRALALAALGVLGLAGAVQAQSALNDVLNNGVLKVGTTGDWNPMSLKDPRTNGYKGYDIDVMTELAKDMGVEVEFVPTDWKTLVNGVISGKYHMTGSASVSAARLKVAGYSESYLNLAFLPFTTADKAERFDGWESVNKKDVVVATTLGTVFERHVRAWFPNAQIKVVEAPARGWQEVISGRADVFVTSNVEGATLVEKFPQITPISVDTPRAPTPIAMLLPQMDQVWINYVNHWIELKKLSGFFDGLAQKYGLAN